MKKFVIFVNVITWGIIFWQILSVPSNFNNRNGYMDLTGAGIITFAILSFWISIINGLITGLCIKEKKNVIIPTIIHGISTLCIAIYAITFLEKKVLSDICSYVLLYFITGGVTGLIMVKIAFFIKALKIYIIRKSKSKTQNHSTTLK